MPQPPVPGPQPAGTTTNKVCFHFTPTPQQREVPRAQSLQEGPRSSRAAVCNAELVEGHEPSHGVPCTAPRPTNKPCTCQGSCSGAQHSAYSSSRLGQSSLRDPHQHPQVPKAPTQHPGDLSVGTALHCLVLLPDTEVLPHTGCRQLSTVLSPPSCSALLWGSRTVLQPAAGQSESRCPGDEDLTHSDPEQPHKQQFHSGPCQRAQAAGPQPPAALGPQVGSEPSARAG